MNIYSRYIKRSRKMYKIVLPGDAQGLTEFERYNLESPKGHFSQSVMWAKVKSNWGWSGVISYDENNKIRGLISLLFRRLPAGLSIMYSPRGPVCDIHDRDTLAELFRGAAELAKKNHSYIFRLDPDVLSSDTEFSGIMFSMGFNLLAEGKNFEGIQPRYVFRLNINGRSKEQLLERFESKTRYNLRLSVRKGVTIKYFSGGSDIPGEELAAFSELMKTTGERDRFMVRDKSYFAKLLKELGDNARLYMAYSGDLRVAGTIAIQYGDKVWYLYGASSNEYRNLMPNYQLQWEMICWAVETGCRIYDFRGVSGDISEDNPLYGLYRFKKGFNGDFCEFAGEFNLIYNKPVNAVMNTVQKAYKKARFYIHMKKAGNGESKVTED